MIINQKIISMYFDFSGIEHHLRYPIVLLSSTIKYFQYLYICYINEFLTEQK